jgi:ABC-2 type transport system permease protein
MALPRRKKWMTAGVGFGIGAAKLLPFLFPPISVWSAFSYTDVYLLWIGNDVSFTKLLNSFGLLASYCIMAYTAGWYLFDRKQM